MRVKGLVLAAGAGSRFGGPKGLARTTTGESWVARAVRMLQDAGCDDVLVAVGASGNDVAALVPPSARVVTVPGWDAGLAATLRAGLVAASLADGEPLADVLVVTPVDTPDAPPRAVERVLEHASLAPGPASGTLLRAVYQGRPGHPVLLGRDHWDVLRAELTGDAGAGRYLAVHGAVQVECGDLWSGADVDR